MHRNQKTPANRRAAAVVECAVVLPVLLIFAFAVLEVTNVIYLQQSLEVAAYEGARVATLPDTNTTDVEATCLRLLTQRGIVQQDVAVSPNNFSDQPFGAPIEVSVTADLGENSFSRFVLGTARTLEGNVIMMKEVN